MSERLRQGLQQRNKREKGDRPLKGKDQAEGRTLADSLPQGAKRTVRKRPKPHPKEKSPSQKDNLLTGGIAGQMDLEADLRSGEHNGKNQEPPKTRSLRKEHPERGHQRLQGAKLSHRPRHQPQPAEMRVGYQRQPQTPSKGWGGNTEP